MSVGVVFMGMRYFCSDLYGCGGSVGAVFIGVM